MSTRQSGDRRPSGFHDFSEVSPPSHVQVETQPTRVVLYDCHGRDLVRSVEVGFRVHRDREDAR